MFVLCAIGSSRTPITVHLIGWVGVALEMEPITVHFIGWVSVTLEMECRALANLGKCSPTEPHPIRDSTPFKNYLMMCL